MINIYQLFPRLFGNKTVQQQFNGTIEANGCGKFNDINQAALSSLKDLGITHIWLTGVIRHASLADYTQYGIPKQHPSLLKGRAGSPYAIVDYYDVDPDLAVNIHSRMQEFDNLLDRIHAQGMKVIIDFIPNHLAREYHSVAKPDDVKDFGEDDNSWLAFHPDNNFYYLPTQSFIPPLRNEQLYQATNIYVEQPAKVTGNDCFNASPGLNDWFETVKLNYGIDYNDMLSHHFEPIPDTWKKMLHVLKFWLSKGVDGFRADMAEMIPVAFWRWLLQELRKSFPELLMIAEIYQSGLYRDFVNAGFDLLYDKIGLYNQMENILIHGHSAESISHCWRQTEGLNNHMLRFMENHDEIRLASQKFLGGAFKALPAVAVSALMHAGGFMIYNGQETAEDADGAVGFSGDDGRTSIFDYCRMPKHQRWMNDGRFDGAKLLFEQQILRGFYKKILRMRTDLPALREGNFYDLMWANPWFTEFDPQNIFAFLRYSKSQCLLIVTNFHKSESRNIRVKIPENAQLLASLEIKEGIDWKAVDLLQDDIEEHYFEIPKLSQEGIRMRISPSSVKIFELNPVVFTSKN